MNPTERAAQLRLTEAWLTRVRERLKWLEEDGYSESRINVVPGQFSVEYRGPAAVVVVSVFPGMSEIEVWLQPIAASGRRRQMQESLKARGLPAPPTRIDATSQAAVERAIDVHTEALRRLRGLELAGNWAPPEPDSGRANYLARREELIDGIVRRARDDSDKG